MQRTLVPREIRHASYHGPFVTKARALFSNSGNTTMTRRETYIGGESKRQAFLKDRWKGSMMEFVSARFFRGNKKGEASARRAPAAESSAARQRLSAPYS